MSQKHDSQGSTAGAWENFLHRPPLVLDRAKAASSLAGKRILVTGAGGWIGSALTKAIAGFALFSSDEYGSVRRAAAIDSRGIGIFQHFNA